jgi:hypothetical protein
VSQELRWFEFAFFTIQQRKERQKRMKGEKKELGEKVIKAAGRAGREGKQVNSLHFFWDLLNNYMGIVLYICINLYVVVCVYNSIYVHTFQQL